MAIYYNKTFDSYQWEEQVIATIAIRSELWTWCRRSLRSRAVRPAPQVYKSLRTAIASPSCIQGYLQKSNPHTGRGGSYLAGEEKEKTSDITLFRNRLSQFVDGQEFERDKGYVAE